MMPCGMPNYMPSSDVPGYLPYLPPNYTISASSFSSSNQPTGPPHAHVVVATPPGFSKASWYPESGATYHLTH